MAENQKESIRKANEDQMLEIKKILLQFVHLEIIEKIGQGSFGEIYKAIDNKRKCWDQLALLDIQALIHIQELNKVEGMIWKVQHIFYYIFQKDLLFGKIYPQKTKMKGLKNFRIKNEKQSQ
ncbi:hypothetical protein IMG5_172630 [Ichthyophthirius multifiliis]|uniref:Protein kinase domain protein n=1 Tax=Ichthyophthirius multifiliis TaxID=5932 RepID=G0R1T7_ICHMU|nr:hypothetical protein IMG5_172630 [Ichthyophthirius multifiliis]EGR28589.1 hypothetical protein IMG5_172630 [Ichthyophthirius multifiliis]|eukprot:XP_004029825.1 hypothetical protein IMG5_172630 [Ichthyophthirius multifiliis]